MDNTPTHAPNSHGFRMLGPRSIFATWHERMRARWKLARMAQENPHLLKDVGLTKQQVEAETAKRFWQR